GSRSACSPRSTSTSSCRRSRAPSTSSSCRRTSISSPIFPRTCRRATCSPWRPWRSASRSSRRSIRAGAPHASIRPRRCAMNSALASEAGRAIREPVVACRGLAKTYEGPQPVRVLTGVDLEVRAGERIAVMGRSGSGKSTLLHLLGGLDRPSGGTVLVRGRPLHDMREAERGKVRNETLGFVYQFHHLLAEFTAV